MYLSVRKRGVKMTDTQYVTRPRRKGRPSKLSENAKDFIVNNYNHGDTQKELAEKYNVSVNTIRKVLAERTRNE